MRIPKLAIIAALSLGCVPVAHAGPLTASDILSQFNAVIANNFTTTSDVEGRLVANHLNGGATFYMPRGTEAASSFAAVNAITVGAGVTNGNINNGGSVDVQGTNAGHFNFNGGGHLTSSPAFAISTFTAPLDALTAQLNGLAANSTVNSNDPNNFTFNAAPDASGRAVFSISSSLLQTARNIVFNAGSATTLVIDVSGGAFNYTGNFNANAFLNQHVIWDFADATSITLPGWHGTVLAPNATVSISSAFEGDLYALNFNGNGELHDFAFAGALPPAAAVPEPASLAMLGAGLFGLGLLRRRRDLRSEVAPAAADDR